VTARLTSEFKVKAMLRRVHDAGGSAMILARGDAMSGAILVLTLERGADPVFHERGLGLDGMTQLIRTGPTSGYAQAVTDYWQRRRRNDPDLWVVELDIASAERFAAETIAVD
jgi:hypothetical protein